MTPTGPDDGNTGDLHVTAPVVIAGVGAGQGGTAIVGSGDRVFDISASAVTLSDMSISGGSGELFGGAIKDVGGSLTLAGDSVHDNTTTSAGGFGGAIFVNPSGDGALTITSSTFSSNTAAENGTSGGGFGGAIMFEPGGTGMMSVTSSTFDSDTAQSRSSTNGGFGGAIMFEPSVAPSSLSVTNSTSPATTLTDASALVGRSCSSRGRRRAARSPRTRLSAIRRRVPTRAAASS